jgi:signal transduction histidine kinase
MKRCVLVIDDDLDTISFISLILEQENYEVLATTDVEEGLIYFETYRPAVLILDLEMPSIHGVQVLKKIKPGIEKDFSVIVLTGYGHDANIKICYELGVYAFLSKPVHLVELKGLVRNAMLWEEYKIALNEHKEQLEELVQQRTLKLSQEIQLRKQTEQQLLHANNMKDKILGVLTLDLRSPLSNIVMNLRYLNENLSASLNNDAQQQVNDAYTEARNTWQLTENLFLWARCQKGEIISHPENCNLKSVVNDTIMFCSQSAEQKKISLVTDIDDSLEVYTDRKIVYTIIQNILSNALKFSHTNSKVTITAKDDKSKVILSITDKGVGMSEDVLPYVMDVSKPISTLGTANEKGSGLGLTICNELAKLIGASLKLDSKKDEGTTVTLSLPKS